MSWVAQLSDFSDRKVRGIMKSKLGPVSCSSGEKKNLTRKSFEWETKFFCQIEFREPNPTARKEFRKSRNTLESQFSFGLIADRLAMLSEKSSYMFADSIKYLNGTFEGCKSNPGTERRWRWRYYCQNFCLQHFPLHCHADNSRIRLNVKGSNWIWF